MLFGTNYVFYQLSVTLSGVFFLKNISSFENLSPARIPAFWAIWTVCKISPFCCVQSVPGRVQFKETKLLEKNSLRKTVDKRSDGLLPKDLLRSQLQRFGFKPHHVNAALAERDELSRALDWLVLHVPETELPPKFAAESSKMSVQVLVRGKQVPDRVQSAYASESVAHLQEYGYSDVDCIEALIEAKGDEVVALGSLFTTLMGKQGGDSRKNGDDGPPESITEMREEELLVLQSIFEEEKMTLSEDSMIFNLSLEEIVDVTLDMEVKDYFAGPRLLCRIVCFCVIHCCPDCWMSIARRYLFVAL